MHVGKRRRLIHHQVCAYAQCRYRSVCSVLQLVKNVPSAADLGPEAQQVALDTLLDKPCGLIT